MHDKDQDHLPNSEMLRSLALPTPFRASESCNESKPNYIIAFVVAAL